FFGRQPHGQAAESDVLTSGQRRLQCRAHAEQQWLIADEDATTIWLFDSRDIAQECRLAGAVGTDDADHLAFSGDEVDAAQRPNGRLSLAPAQGMADAPQAFGSVTGVVGVDGVADLDVLRDDVGLFEFRVDHSSPPLARRTRTRR